MTRSNEALLRAWMAARLGEGARIRGLLEDTFTATLQNDSNEPLSVDMAAVASTTPPTSIAPQTGRLRLRPPGKHQSQMTTPPGKWSRRLLPPAGEPQIARRSGRFGTLSAMKTGPSSCPCPSAPLGDSGSGWRSRIHWFPVDKLESRGYSRLNYSALGAIRCLDFSFYS